MLLFAHAHRLQKAQEDVEEPKHERSLKELVRILPKTGETRKQ